MEQAAAEPEQQRLEPQLLAPKVGLQAMGLLQYWATEEVLAAAAAAAAGNRRELEPPLFLTEDSETAPAAAAEP